MSQTLQQPTSGQVRGESEVLLRIFQLRFGEIAFFYPCAEFVIFPEEVGAFAILVIDH